MQSKNSKCYKERTIKQTRDPTSILKEDLRQLLKHPATTGISLSVFFIICVIVVWCMRERILGMCKREKLNRDIFANDIELRITQEIPRASTSTTDVKTPTKLTRT